MIYNVKSLIKEPIALFFNILFPWLWIIISFYAFTSDGDNSQLGLIFSFSVILTMNLLTITLASLPIELASCRLQKFNQQLVILKVKKWHFLTAFLLTHLMLFIIMFWVLFIVFMLISNLKFEVIIYLFLLFILFFTLLFYAGMLLGSLFSSISTTQAVAQLIFFAILLTSGIMISPTQTGSWFIYLQKISPGGNMISLVEQIILQSKIALDLFLLLYLTIFTLITAALSHYFFRFT